MTKGMVVNPGRLRHRVTIEQYTETVDGYGDPDRTYTALATVWAEVRPNRGTEQIIADTYVGSQTYEILMRYRDDVSTFDRVTWNGKTAEIQEIRDVEERGVWMYLTVVETK